MILKIILYNTQYFFLFLWESEKMKSYKRVTIELRDIRDDRILTRFPTLCRTLLLHVHTMWNRIAPICPHSNEPLIDVCTQQRRNQDLSVKFISRWLDQRPRGVLTSKRWLKIDIANCAKKRADGSKFQFWVWNELKIYAIKKSCVSSRRRQPPWTWRKFSRNERERAAMWSWIERPCMRERRAKKGKLKKQFQFHFFFTGEIRLEQPSDAMNLRKWHADMKIMNWQLCNRCFRGRKRKTFYFLLSYDSDIESLP